MDHSYDVIVIGAGAVGENAADAAARHGLKVAIVEEELVGGECSYWACMPSKALLNPGKLIELVKRAPGAAEAIQGRLDSAAALERRNSVAAGWDDTSQVDWLESQGIDLIRGRARITGERRLSVAASDGSVTDHEASRAVIVATGSKPGDPGIAGMDEVAVWDNRDITSADKVPDRVLFVGGGGVGVEMAQAWSWLGSQVTLVHNSGRLLKGEEPFVGEELRTHLENQGIEVYTKAETRRVRTGEGGIVATVEGEEGTFEIEADEVVAATGRRPRTDDLGLDAVGLETGRFLEVDDHMRVKDVDGGWLYAVGDVNGRALFTHMGKYQARIAGSHVGGSEGAAAAPHTAVPRVFFTSPEIAAVGMTEQQARQKGIEVATVTHDIGKVAAASVLGQGHAGTCKLVIDDRKGIVVGATFVGPQVADLLHSATIAIVGRIPLEVLWHAVPSFPTFSEVWLRLLEKHRDAGWDPYPPIRSE